MVPEPNRSINQRNEKSHVSLPRKPLKSRCTDALIRLTDFALATVLLIVFGLPMLIISMAIYIEDGGPVLFRQTRIGKGLSQFSIFKFRTMTVDPTRDQGNLSGNPAQSAAFQRTTKGDARITRVGRILRPLHLDELPQVLNVFIGDMSVVGVRPDVPVQEIEYAPDDWLARHTLRPGITGLAQIDPSVDSMQTRTARDLTWVQTHSYRLYLRILAGTVWKVLKRNSL